MKHTLHIQHRAVEGAIIRVLGLVERRGFRIERVQVGEAAGDGVEACQAMRLTVAGERPVALVQRQVERLHDVMRVDIETTGPGAPQWTGAAVVRPVAQGN